MNLAEAHDLLTYIAVFDNRKFDDASVVAWQSVLHDLPAEDCRSAACDHFAGSREYLMPVHIRDGALARDRARRRQAREQAEQAEQAERLALEADPVRDRSADVLRLLAQLRDALPDTDIALLRRPEVLEWDRARQRTARAEPNPHYVAPPPGGHPVPGDDPQPGAGPAAAGGDDPVVDDELAELLPHLAGLSPAAMAALADILTASARVRQAASDQPQTPDPAPTMAAAS